MLYEGNPDRTNVRERFLYKFETPIAEPTPAARTTEQSLQPGPATTVAGSSTASPPAMNGLDGSEMAEVPIVHDTHMSNHADVVDGPAQDQQGDQSKDTDMAETS